MKNLVFYPTFEPNNDRWLKYALIHIDNFSPIIPKSGEKKLSANFNKIINESDLIKIIEPHYQEAALASLDTMKELDIIEKEPDFYRDLFDVPNIIRKFKDNDNWNYEIFSEKYNSSFQEYLIKKEYAYESPNGIITSPEIAQLFMTLLANRTAQSGNTNPITDTAKFNTLSLALNEKNKNNTDNIQQLAQSVIDIKIPKQIDNISFDKLIEFRNTDGILELRNAFNKNLNKFYTSIEENKDPNDFIKSLEEYHKSYTAEIVLFFGAVAVVTIDAVTSMFGDDKLQILKNMIKATPLLKSVTSINKTYKEDNEIVKGRKFLTKISNME